MPTSFQLLVEQASEAFFQEDKANFEHALTEARSLIQEDEQATELLDEALELFPLGEALECLHAAEAQIEASKNPKLNLK